MEGEREEGVGGWGWGIGVLFKGSERVKTRIGPDKDKRQEKRRQNRDGADIIAPPSNFKQLTSICLLYICWVSSTLHGWWQQNSQRWVKFRLGVRI
jgi:hypothetical protein